MKHKYSTPAGAFLTRLPLHCGVALLLIAGLTLSGCQLADVARFSLANARATATWTSEEHVTTVPFTLIDNHIIVPVSLNGSETLSFVLDSGAAASVIIDSRATRALPLTLAGEIQVSGVGKGPAPTARLVPRTSMAIGSLSLDGQTAVYLPLASIPFFSEYDQVYFDGVIGAPFLSRFVVEVDYEKGLITFSEPEVAAARIAGLDNLWRELPLEIKGGVPYARARVDAGQGDVEVKLLVDTGARSALMLTPGTHRDLHRPTDYFTSINDGLSGEIESRVAVTSSFKFAGFNLTQLPASFAIAGGEHENGSNGIIGNQLLKQFNLLFDYDNDRLFLRPNGDFAEPIFADRSGLQVRPHANGGQIKRIAPGSVAEASALSVGDVITQFDQTRVDARTIGELKQALASDKKEVNLCWRDGEREQCGALALRSRFE